jgi:2-dehydro-3-deoxyphosphogluconate aldolase/(4S)-4-hydroxy-2-oxoglutarate aldolase
MTVLQQLSTHKIVPVLVMEDAAQASPLADALLAGGLGVAEVTFRTQAAQAAIAALADRGDMLVGAGTVLTREQVDRAIDAGAQFIVAPGTNPTVVEHALSRGVPMFPGVATPTDIEMAMSLGLNTMKYFPAGAFGGLNTLNAIAGPYGDVRFIPTGGVNINNLSDYLSHPKVVAVGGSWVAKKTLISAGEWNVITDLTRAAVDVAATCE